MKLKPLFLSMVVCALVCSISLLVTQWVGLPDKWCIFISVFLGIALGTISKRLW